MARKKRGFRPLDPFNGRSQDLADQIPSRTEFVRDEHESGSHEYEDDEQQQHEDPPEDDQYANYDEGQAEYFVFESELRHKGTLVRKTAGLRAQGPGEKTVFAKDRKNIVEEQGVVVVNNAKPVAHVWNKRKHGRGDVRVEDLWDTIDEEEAPMPNFNNKSKFESYSDDFEDELEQIQNSAYLRHQLASVSKQLKKCKLEGMKLEGETEQALWDRNQTQKKNHRMESFTKYVIGHCRQLVTKSVTIEQQCKKERESLEESERDIKGEYMYLEASREDTARLHEILDQNTAATKEELAELRKSTLTDDEHNKAIRLNIMAAVEEEMYEAIVADNKMLLQERSKLEKEQGALADERLVSQAKLDNQMGEATKKAIWDEGHAVGLNVGRKIEDMEQYKRGYYWGRHHASKRPKKEHLADARQEGKNQGIVETTAQYEKFIGEISDSVVHKLIEAKTTAAAKAAAETRELVTNELSREFAEERQHVHRHARAYGLYEGSITQIRRHNNIEGSEAEELAQVTRIAAVCAEQYEIARAENKTDKTPWRNYLDETWPLSITADSVLNTSFCSALMPKLEEQAISTESRLQAAKEEERRRAKEAADAVKKDYASRDAATAASPEGQFEPVQSGPPAPPPRPLPPLIEEEPEDEEAREINIAELPPAWWQKTRILFT